MKSIRHLALLIALCTMVSIASADQPPVFDISWGSEGSEAGQFSFPTGIGLGETGVLYVADFANSRIQAYDVDSTFLFTWGVLGSDPGEFNQPQGLTIAPNGDIYVADTFNHRIQVFSADSTFITEWGEQGPGDGEFNVPRDVDLGLDGTVYVADASNHRIQSFTADGTFIDAWGSLGAGEGEFNSPQHLAVGPEGNVYVSEVSNNRIQKLDSTGVFLLAWGGVGSGDGQFTNPRGVAVDGSGNVYVADLRNRIQKFTDTGEFLTSWGELGSEPGNFRFPESIVVDAIGTVYVVDSGNNRVQRFVPAPLISTISDVGNDQGGQVRIDLVASSQDAANPLSAIVQYEAFRRVDPLPGELAKTGERAASARAGGMLSEQGILLTGWEFVAAIPAHAEDDYSMIAPTLADTSSEYGIHHTFLFVRAATDNPAVFYDSPVDSGFSVDNLVPNVPSGFAVDDVSPGGDVTLSWSASDAPDFRHFSLHRGTELNFTPSEANLVTRTTEINHVDAGAAPGGGLVYYKVSASDFAGNESDFAVASTGVVAVGSGGGLPTVFALHPAVPNPLRHQTTLGFDLPISTPVTLRFYDARGRMIRQAYDGSILPAGRHQWVWDRRDDSGRRVAPGMYFYTLVSPQFAETRKAVVVQ